MAQQDGGWPLRLQPLNARIELSKNHDFSGSLSFNTITTASTSPSSLSFTSSDLDTESKWSFFHDKSITLGSLIGISGFTRRRRRRCSSSEKKNQKTMACFFLCYRSRIREKSAINGSSLGHFLAVERRSSNAQRTEGLSVSEKRSSLFLDGAITPPNAMVAFLCPCIGKSCH